MPKLGLRPSYAELVGRYHLSVLFGGGDLVLDDNGDLKQARDGDLFFGTPPVNAMHRLANGWSYNEPAMRLLFETVGELRQQQAEHKAEVGRSLYGTDAVLALWDASDAGRVGCGALTGGLAVIGSSLLSRFKADLRPSPADWAGGSPAYHEVSAGRLLVAAANAFRHADEWAAARFSREITAQQRVSMDALAQALAIDPFAMSDKSDWEAAIEVLSGGSFDGFVATVLGFANDVARMTQERI